MKKIMTLAMMFIVFNSFASMDATDSQGTQPSPAQLQTNRACWASLTTLGCGDPGSEPEHFRSCMNNVFNDLAPSCKKLMTDLYK